MKFEATKQWYIVNKDESIRLINTVSIDDAGAANNYETRY